MQKDGYTYLNKRQIHKLWLCNCLICLPEHALFEEELAGRKFGFLGVEVTQDICYVLTVVQKDVLV